MNNPQQDQPDNQDQLGGIFGNQDQSNQQQNDPNQYGQQDPATMQPDQTQQQDAGPLGSVRRAGEQQVDQGIDNAANRIPGGDQYSQKAKDAASSGMDRLQQEGENRGGDMSGGIFGGNQENS